MTPLEAHQAELAKRDAERVRALRLAAGALFAALDTDGDGQLDRDEIQAFVDRVRALAPVVLDRLAGHDVD